MVKQTVNCKIIRFHDHPTDDETGDVLPGTNIELECWIGERRWRRIIYVNYDRPISFEEFLIELKKIKLIPKKPTDHLAYVKEEVGKAFEIIYEIKKTNKK